MMIDRPKFLPSYLDLLRHESNERSWLAIIPFWLMMSLVMGFVIAYFVPDKFWSDERWDISTAVYSGLLTFNGLVLALGWGAFSRIYGILFRGDFASYLREKDLLNPYLVHVNFMHGSQIFAALTSAAGLLLVLIDGVPISLDRTILGMAVAMTAYAIKQAVDAIICMNDLVWQAAIFEDHTKRTGKNVVPVSFDKGNA